MFDIRNGIEDIKRRDKLAALEREFPGESCGNIECGNLCAEALHIAKTMRLDPKTMIEDSIRQGIAPKTHCVPASVELTPPFFTAPCRFGFVSPDLTCIKNSNSMSLSSVAEEEQKVIAKKYITDSDASKEGVCKECLKNANHVFKWPEEAHLMPKLPIHPNCKCYYKNVIADDSEKTLIMSILIPIWNRYVDNKRKIQEFVQITVELMADSAEAMLKASSYMASRVILARMKFYLDVLEIRIKIWAVVLENIIKTIDFVMTFIKTYSSSPFCVKIISALQDWAREVRDGYDDIKAIHYNRLKMVIQQVRYLPKNPKEARSSLAKEDGWEKATDIANSYHKNKGQINNVKYYNPKTGQEVVYESDADDAKIVTAVNNIGTYNYESPKKFFEHSWYDVLPYYLWGNSINDDTLLGDRMIGNR